MLSQGQGCCLAAIIASLPRVTDEVSAKRCCLVPPSRSSFNPNYPMFLFSQSLRWKSSLHLVSINLNDIGLHNDIPHMHLASSSSDPSSTRSTYNHQPALLRRQIHQLVDECQRVNVGLHGNTRMAVSLGSNAVSVDLATGRDFHGICLS